jgi:hypothetical protein
MTARILHGSGITVGVVLFSFVGIAPGSASATTPIYKCFDRNLGLLYTDEPCQEGELLNIRAGDADPAAVARLERARDALDQSAAQRIADQRRAPAPANLPAWYTDPRELDRYDDSATNAPYDDGAPWWLAGFARPHPPRSRPPKSIDARRLAFPPPQMMPRF